MEGSSLKVAIWFQFEI